LIGFKIGASVGRATRLGVVRIVRRNVGTGGAAVYRLAAGLEEWSENLTGLATLSIAIRKSDPIWAAFFDFVVGKLGQTAAGWATIGSTVDRADQRLLWRTAALDPVPVLHVGVTERNDLAWGTTFEIRSDCKDTSATTIIAVSIVAHDCARRCRFALFLTTRTTFLGDRIDASVGRAALGANKTRSGDPDRHGTIRATFDGAIRR
jgi:hypothetical protein